MNIQMLLNLGTAPAPGNPDARTSTAGTGDSAGFATAFEQILRRHSEASGTTPAQPGLPANLLPTPAAALPALPDAASAIAQLARQPEVNDRSHGQDPALPLAIADAEPEPVDDKIEPTLMGSAEPPVVPIGDTANADPASERATGDSPQQPLPAPHEGMPAAVAVSEPGQGRPATPAPTAAAAAATAAATAVSDTPEPSPAPPPQPAPPQPPTADNRATGAGVAPGWIPARGAAEPATAPASGNTDIAAGIAGAGEPPAPQVSRPTPAAPPALTAPVTTPQWGQQLGEQMVVMARRGEQQVSLKLNPAELGPLNVELRVIDHQAQLHLASASAQVRGAIEQAIPQLREALAEQGIALGEATVNDQRPGDQHQGFAAGRDHDQSESLATDRSTEDTPTPQAVAFDGRVNLYV